MLTERRAVFVTLRQLKGELRGCRGRLAAKENDLVRETWQCATAAAFHDYRFPPLTAPELPETRFSVTVLGELEPVVSPAELDPAVYGVAVAAVDGRKGVLLPAIAGIETVKQQLAIARQKAGIEPEEWVKLQRFRAKSFREPGPARRRWSMATRPAAFEHPARWWRSLARRPPRMPPVPARLQAAGRPARLLLRAAACAATRSCSTTYGRSTGFCIDPIEKKPLNHFYPGTQRAVVRHRRLQPRLQVLPELGHQQVARRSTGWATRPRPRPSPPPPEHLGCRSVAFTYNDPVIWAEYAIDTARACHDRGHQDRGRHRRLHHARGAARSSTQAMDAANVDLKGFTEEFYHRRCLGHLQPVLDTLRWLRHETDVWFEITNLLIPGENDSPDEIDRVSDWYAANLGPDVPLHFTAFHPDFKMLDTPRTPPATLTRARDIARAKGLQATSTPATSTTPRAGAPAVRAAARW